MSNLLDHARREMQKAGLYDSDADYDAAIAPCVEELVRVLERQGHSGGSHRLVLDTFIHVANFRPLTSLTNNPDEWMEVGNGFWQSRRSPSCFSKDGGKTYYDLDTEGRPTVVSAPSK